MSYLLLLLTWSTSTSKSLIWRKLSSLREVLHPGTYSSRRLRIKNFDCLLSCVVSYSKINQEELIKFKGKRMLLEVDNTLKTIGRLSNIVLPVPIEF